MSDGTITMSRLGDQGRFGNWLFQYGFLKTYARQFNLTVQTPNWPGRMLFGAADPPIEKPLRMVNEPADEDFADKLLTLKQPLTGVDLSGYFQYHTSRLAEHRSYWQSLFQPAPAIAEKLEPYWNKLSGMGRTVVAFHIRRTDYGFSHYYRTPYQWYHAWLEKFWPTFDNPVLFIASDAAGEARRAFADYPVVTSRQLGAKLPEAPYFPDHFLLSRAHQLVTANSTYSVSAAMVSRNLQQAYRPHLCDPLGDPPFRLFDPWSDVVIDRSAVAEEFPHIPGLCRPRGIRRLLEKLKRSTSKRLERLGL